MVIADLSVMEAEIEVNETDIVAVKLNQPAIVNVDALPLTPLQGVVSEIGNSAITRLTSQEAKEFKVAIRLTSPPSTLRPGLSCTADITTDTRSNVLTIPIQALVIREYPVDASGKPIKVEDGQTVDKDSLQEFEGVFAVRGDRAEFVPVRVGISGRTIMEIESGVDEDTDIVSGSYKTLRDLADDDPIEIKDESDDS